MSSPTVELTQRRRDVLALLERLHRHKDAAYGDAWRKRGEVIAIFANMARKYDRLLIAFEEHQPAATESLADTVGDLCNYTGKYLTWIAEQHPDEFVAAAIGIAPDTVSPAHGPEPLATLFGVLADERSTTPPPHSAEAWRDARGSFDALDRALMAQSTPGAPAAELLDFTAKTRLAWTLCIQLAWLLTLLQAEDDTTLDRMCAEVEAMDRRAQP